MFCSRFSSYFQHFTCDFWSQTLGFHFFDRVWIQNYFLPFRKYHERINVFQLLVTSDVTGMAYMDRQRLFLWLTLFIQILSEWKNSSASVKTSPRKPLRGTKTFLSALNQCNNLHVGRSYKCSVLPCWNLKHCAFMRTFCDSRISIPRRFQYRIDT